MFRFLFVPLLFVFFLSLPQKARSQTNFVLENIATLVVPIGDLANEQGASGAIGFADFLRLGYFFGKDVRVDLESGILTIGQRSERSPKAHAFLIPIRLNGTYYFLDGETRPFVAFGIGYSPTIIRLNFQNGPSYYQTNFLFGWTAAAGIAYAFAENWGVVGSARFHSVATKDSEFDFNFAKLKATFNAQALEIGAGIQYYLN